MMCDNMVEQITERGFGYRTTIHKCGTTGVTGEMLLCDAHPNECSNKTSYGRPWFICRHGNDVSEYMCGACELD